MAKKKYTCPSIVPSACVLYTGTLPDFIDESALDCEPNIDEILQKYGSKIDAILSGIDLNGLDKKCFSFTPATVTVKELHQLQIDKICNLQTRVETLESAIENLNIGSQHITIDLKCLKPSPNPCSLPTDTYTLLAVLNIIVNEICEIKTQIS